MSQTILITGTSTGFGHDGALALARRGHRVFATMRDFEGRNAKPRAELEAIAGAEQLKLEVLELDVTSDESVRSAVETALSRAERLDVVINNAGYAGIGVTEGYTPEQYKQMFDVNVLGPVRVNRAVLPAMRRQRSGLLIHVSSGAGRCVVPAMAVYCASKFALEAVADAYRFELLPFNINSILVEPGIYRTPIFHRIAAPADRDRADEYGDFVDRVLGVFHTAITQPENPGTAEVVEALVRLVEMDNAERPFRTVVSPPIQQLLEPYNAAAESLRPVVAQIFNVPELAGTAVAAVE